MCIIMSNVVRVACGHADDSTAINPCDREGCNSRTRALRMQAGWCLICQLSLKTRCSAEERCDKALVRHAWASVLRANGSVMPRRVQPETLDMVKREHVVGDLEQQAMELQQTALLAVVKQCSDEPVLVGDDQYDAPGDDDDKQQQVVVAAMALEASEDDEWDVKGPMIEFGGEFFILP